VDVVTPERPGTGRGAPIVKEKENERGTERENEPLAMSAAELRALGHALVDEIAEHLEAVSTAPVARDVTVASVRAMLPAALPEEGEDAGHALRDAARILRATSTFNASPRFFGYVTSSPAPIGILGELLAAAMNQNVSGWKLAPGAAEIERQCVRWLAELVGYPVGEGLLVSGGAMANLHALLVARHAARRGPGAGHDGSAGEPTVALATRETHVWLRKSIHAIYSDREMRLVEVACDAEGRMRPDALAAALAQQEGALRVVIATAGNVSTGAVDPLEAIADVTSRAGVWLHVDGAYGAFGALAGGGDDGDLEGLRDRRDQHHLRHLRHLRRADSLALDPHKWLCAPIEAGCLLVRDGEKLRATFTQPASYYHRTPADAADRTTFHELGLQNTRGFRALKVWLCLRHAGRSGYRRLVRRNIELARSLFARASVHPELEAVTCSLSITTFRYRPLEPRSDAELDALNAEIIARLQLAGRVFLSNALVGGRFLLRACVVNLHTREADLDALVEEVVGCGRQICRGAAPGRD